MEKLNVKALAVALGLTWGFLVLCMGWTSAFGWGTRLVEVMSSVYIGYAPSFIGGIIGALWGLFDGAVGGLIIALVYNAIARTKIIVVRPGQPGLSCQNSRFSRIIEWERETVRYKNKERRVGSHTARNPI